MENERLKKQIEFSLEADKEKLVTRQTLVSDSSRGETDAEHAWHLALMCILLSEYADEKIDLLKTVTMVLIHDIVEIDAGDTYAYDENAKQTQALREQTAADRIFKILPEEQGEKLKALWYEFEECTTAEAKFAHTMDNFQPVMLNAATDGKMWLKNKVKLSQILKRNEVTGEGSKQLWEFSCNNFIKPNVEKGRIKDDVN